MIETLIWYYHCTCEMLFFICITVPMTFIIVTTFYLLQEIGPKIMLCIGVVMLAVLLVLPDREEIRMQGERYQPVCLPEAWY
ncbi:hypothetical protein TWF225_010761 [Orbilia oligospora]|uniref:Uncharacterized protein n=1 Tax=Orbilia oligospora TaxID=2813651 RepID=A0A8H2EBR0_ORBOL|nr:hypothetical protein TWF225_010761 [Orbilia oligospora]KAF3242536.1 hypothetical protein TWF128_010500 [Orbilia oligospora]TGJ72909.1 hypothetical protein EYR41_000034 [Orbilia oligospora]